MSTKDAYPPDSRATVERFVVPFYLKFLHANCLPQLEEPESSFVQSVRQAMSSITIAQIGTLLAARNWRERLAAAWLIGLRRDPGFDQSLHRLLQESSTCYAGQGYCFALARIGSDAAIASLAAYLDFYLPAIDRQYDQDWAVAALRSIDQQRSSRIADRYLDRPEDWRVTAGYRKGAVMKPRDRIESFGRLMRACEARFG